MDWLIPPLQDEKMVRDCLPVLEAGGSQVLERYFYRIYADLGRNLPTLVRNFLIAPFLFLFDEGADHLSESFLRTLLQKYAKSKEG
jgi:hypothetical protein